MSLMHLDSADDEDLRPELHGVEVIHQNREVELAIEEVELPVDDVAET